MYFSFSDGREIIKADMCSHCQLNTAGQHESNCPLAFVKTEIAPEIKTEIKIFRIDERKE